MIHKKVLIVDNDRNFLNRLVVQLQISGFDIITAESQKEAEEILSKLKPDLAVFNLIMENEDSGFILSYKLRRKHPSVPIIITSNASTKTGIIFNFESNEEKKWINADSYLEKEVSPDQLHKEILKLLKL